MLIPVPRALWQIYAAIKYWSRERHGPRERTGTIQVRELAVAMCNILEVAWREGYREELLTKEVWKEIRRRKEEERGPGHSDGEPGADSGVVRGDDEPGCGGDSGVDRGTPQDQGGTPGGDL